MSDNFTGNMANFITQEPMDYEELAPVEEAEEYILPDDPPLGEEQTVAAAPVSQDAAAWSTVRDDVFDQGSSGEARSGQSAGTSSLANRQTCRPDGKPYSSKQKMEDRKRLDKNEKPYGCEMCKKRFSSTTNIKEHLRTHSDDRKEQCAFCKNNFKFRSSLTKHVKKNHPEFSKNIPSNSRKSRRNDGRAGKTLQGDS